MLRGYWGGTHLSIFINVLKKKINSPSLEYSIKNFHEMNYDSDRTLLLYIHFDGTDLRI